MSTSITDYRKVGINMKKNGRSKAKHVKQKNNRIVTSEGVAAKAEAQAESEVNPQYLNANVANLLKNESAPLEVLEEQLVYRCIRQLVSLEHERDNCELELTSDIIQKFNDRMNGWQDITQQIEIVKLNMSEVRTLSGLLKVLKSFEDDKVYRNPSNNYRVTLDDRICKLSGEFYERFFGIYLSERERFCANENEEENESNNALN